MVTEVAGKICAHDSCGVVFTATGTGAHLRRYCDEHYVGNTGKLSASVVRAKRIAGLCEACGNKIPSHKRAGAKYCTPQCSRRARDARRKARLEQFAELEELTPETSAKIAMRRRGPIYNKLMSRPELVRQLLDGNTSQVAAAHILDTTEASISRALVTIRYEEELRIRNGQWEASAFTKAMLPTEKLLRIKELGPEGEGTEEFEQLADELTRAYSVFSRCFFQLEGVRPLIEDFHLRWIRAIIVAYAVGGKQLILSPPRHGKSEMMIRFVVWMIVMFPNIRIVWVAANGDVAGIMLGAVKDHLEHNERLIRATLPRGHSYRPDRNSGRKWTGKEIKVRQQTHVGAKSSSMLALGAESSILSRDMDIIIVDDLEDFKNTKEPNRRRKNKKQFAEYGTRKTELTAWIDIGSRQHPDDVAGALLKGADTEQGWRIIVDTAHSEECALDPDVIAGHDESGCVLFPAVRSYRWLMEKKAEMEVLGVEGAYEMRYLNRPIPEDGMVFDMAEIRANALDRSRDLGTEDLPAGRLVAGLDPAAKGTQAAFCWHYTNETMTMVDLDTQRAGGFAGALEIMRTWHTEYGLQYWFYEENATQSEFFNDPRTKALAIELGLVIKPYQTGLNKTDPEIGISSMAPWYHSGRIILPYGTDKARRKVNQLLRQLEHWTTDGIVRGRNRKTDIKMASWFPFPTIIKWGKADREVRLEEEQMPDYPGGGFVEVPWETNYPGAA